MSGVIDLTSPCSSSGAISPVPARKRKSVSTSRAPDLSDFDLLDALNEDNGQSSHARKKPPTRTSASSSSALGNRGSATAISVHEVASSSSSNSSSSSSNNAHELRTFAVYNSRRHVTSSAKRRRKVFNYSRIAFHAFPMSLQ